MANRKPNQRVALDGEIRLLHERIASVGAKAAEYLDSDRDLALLLDVGSIAMWTTDDSLHLQSCRGVCDPVLPATAAPGVCLSEVFEENDLRLTGMRAALEGRESRATLFCTDRVFAFCVRPLTDTAGLITGTCSVAIDVTKQHKLQQELSNSEQRYRELFENANDLIFTHGPDGKLTSINQAVERMLGYAVSEALSMRIHDMLAPESQAGLENCIAELRRNPATQTWEATAIARSGKHVFLEMALRLVHRDGAPVSVEGIARDVTERRLLEDQIRQSQKMEAIGVLAGGIAHDFNNLLTGILGYAYLMQAEPDLDTRLAEAINVIVRSAERAAQLTTQLLGFARRSKDQNVPVDIHATLQELVELLGRTIDKRISIETKFGSQSPHVMGDPGQVYQLLLNVCLNARDAMPGGGTLKITTAVTKAAVSITIADTGQGMPPEIRDRIFEPFFTTKEPGKGTGMGLAMVYGIVRNHGGTVHVETAPGKGSSFHITLPVCTSQSVEPAPKQKAERGVGRILIVDDEEVVRQVLARMLKGLGYEVIAEGDSYRAVEYYKSHYKEVDAVVVDMMMPGLGGRDVYYSLRAANPNARVVLSSGYSRDDSAAELIRETGIEFLQKPYQIEQLAAVLRKTMATKAAAPATRHRVAAPAT